jgi:hypothetical protein
MATDKPSLWYWYCVQPAKRYRRGLKDEVAVFRGYEQPAVFGFGDPTPHLEYGPKPVDRHNKFGEVVLVGEMTHNELLKLTKRKGTRMKAVPRDLGIIGDKVFRAEALQKDAPDAWKLRGKSTSRPLHQYFSLFIHISTTGRGK